MKKLNTLLVAAALAASFLPGVSSAAIESSIAPSQSSSAAAVGTPFAAQQGATEKTIDVATHCFIPGVGGCWFYGPPNYGIPCYCGAWQGYTDG